MSKALRFGLLLLVAIGVLWLLFKPADRGHFKGFVNKLAFALLAMAALVLVLHGFRS